MRALKASHREKENLERYLIMPWMLFASKFDITNIEKGLIKNRSFSEWTSYFSSQLGNRITMFSVFEYPGLITLYFNCVNCRSRFSMKLVKQTKKNTKWTEGITQGNDVKFLLDPCCCSIKGKFSTVLLVKN